MTIRKELKLYIEYVKLIRQARDGERYALAETERPGVHRLSLALSCNECVALAAYEN